MLVLIKITYLPTVTYTYKEWNIHTTSNTYWKGSRALKNLSTGHMCPVLDHTDKLPYCMEKLLTSKVHTANVTMSDL